MVGGGSSIGWAVAEEAGAEGADVVLSSRTAAKLEEAARAIGGARVLPVDVTAARPSKPGRASWPRSTTSSSAPPAPSAAHGTFADLDEGAVRAELYYVYERRDLIRWDWSKAVASIAECPGDHDFEIMATADTCELLPHYGRQPNYLLYRGTLGGC